jgi:hypothetical protein
MKTYRLHLAAGANGAHVDFQASGDAEAAATGAAVFHACTDICDGYEVRREARWIAGMAKPLRPGDLRAEELSAHTQELVLQTEEAVISSETLVAQSERLLERTAHIAQVIRWRQSGGGTLKE